MSDFIKLYGGTVTKGGTDGTPISENMTQSNPMAMSLNAKVAEAKVMKLALRCESGFQTSGDVVVSANRYDGTNYVATGGNIDKFRFAADEGFDTDAKALANANWVNSLTISDVIGATNYTFWFKVMSDTTQTPTKDTSVSIHVVGTVEAV